jgi:hypothetical protein
MHGRPRTALLRWSRRSAVSAALWLTSLPLAFAGGGVFNDDGTIDFTLNFRFPPSPDTIDLMKTRIRDASHRLWDASEGQIRFGNVAFTATRVGEDLADVWLYPQEGRARSAGGISIPGNHVTLYSDDEGGTIAHEFGHLALELGDEYDEQKRFGKCYGIGPCMEAAVITSQNQCIMQSSSSYTEYCTAGRHDLLLGNNISCLVQPGNANGAPCTDYCELWNLDTLRYETTSHTTSHEGKSCWESLVERFPFLSAPAGLPVAAEPGGFTDPVFSDNTEAADTVLLMLDRSGSMTYAVDSDDGEVCDNGKDDDGDGSIDEDPCTDSRMEFVRAAARAFVDLSTGSGVRVGLVSFAESQTTNSSFLEMDAAGAQTLKDKVDGLHPGGCTAIGDALVHGQSLFASDAEAGDSKAILLITDGFNTCGADPATVVDDVADAGIRVFTVATGSASDDPLLGQISGESNGERVDTREASALVSAFTQQWAHYSGGGVIVPKLPYRVTSNATFTEPPDELRTAENWASGDDAPWSPSGTFAPLNNRIGFHVEKGTKRVSVVVAGDITDMDRFGVRAMLDAPSGTDFDSDVPHPNLRVVKDGFYLLLEITDPAAGDWVLDVRGVPGNNTVQTGNATIISDHPTTDLFAAVDRHVVTSPTQAVTMNLVPVYDTPLFNLEWDVRVKRPDGSIVPVPVITDEFTNKVSAVVTGFGMKGMYEVRALLRTTAATLNDPGESLFSTEPSNGVTVPILERSAARYIYAVSGRPVCTGTDPGDCDGDGIFQPFDSCDKDSDGDGLADCYDPDSDNDEIPDSVEWKGTPSDLDGDGVPDHQDPDADGDGIFDANDPRIQVPRPPDVDGDGRFTQADIVAILRISGGLQAAAPGNVAAGDDVSDGHLTVTDAVALQRRLTAPK